MQTLPNTRNTFQTHNFIVMRKFTVVFITIGLLVSCSTVPLTGRKQFKLLPESQLMQMSLTEYRSFLSANKVVQGTEQSEMVRRVGNHISSSATGYLNKIGYGDRVAGYKWEFNLVEDKTVNAWCMPGGKVVFYTGILPVTQSEAGLAVVMGHEIAHAIARHGNERMSQQLMIMMGGIALDVALMNQREETRALFLTAYGIGSTVGVALPFSRKHESEADKMGLVFMAMAGYDPNESIAFWKRMAALGGQKPPQWMSTHPSDETRIKNLKKYIPEAMKVYKPRN